MTTEAYPHVRHLPLLVCACGTVLITCQVPGCPQRHPLREVEACGVCTATGGMPASEDNEEDF
jgi:hypothetical protein